MPDSDPSEQLLQQHAETSRLLGVDFLPRAASAGPPQLAPVSSATTVEPGPNAESPDRPSSDAKRGALEQLRERYERDSTVARDMPGWNNIVFGEGDPDARLMFIGEAPGADEDASGRPFVGRAGQKLEDMIKAMGFARDSVYITNILKVRPPNNRTPTVLEAQAEGPFLEEQIAIIAPEVIVTLGKPASNFVLSNSESMGRMRGKWWDYYDTPVMPTYHPAFLLRQYTQENRAKVWSDLQKVVQRLGGE